MIAARTVGMTLPPFRGVIERVKIVEYAQATHLKNPIYFDAAAARAAGFRDVVAPLGYLNPFTLQPRAPKFEVFQINEHTALAGEWSWDHHIEVCAGDELHGQSVLIEIGEKQGKRPMTVLVIETKYMNANNENVVTVRDMTLEFKE
jgi:hypothetical protein